MKMLTVLRLGDVSADSSMFERGKNSLKKKNLSKVCNCRKISRRHLGLKGDYKSLLAALANYLRRPETFQELPEL